MRFNPVLEKLTPYRAGPPLHEVQERYQLERVAMLSANEVPWGPFPEVVDAMTAALSGLNRYPDGGCKQLRALIAEQRGIAEEYVTFGNGSCELLMLLGVAFLSPQHHVVFPHPSFVMYRSIALTNGARFSAVPLAGLDYDLDAMLAAVQEDTSLLVICNPNNPTGSYIKPGEMRRFVESVPRDVCVVLDEAYGEFVTDPDQEDTAAWLADNPNLVILHTFSKIYGLAGLRIGYGIGRPPDRAGVGQGPPTLQRRLARSGRGGRIVAPAPDHAAASRPHRLGEGYGWLSGSRRWEWRTIRAKRTSCWWT